MFKAFLLLIIFIDFLVFVNIQNVLKLISLVGNYKIIVIIVLQSNTELWGGLKLLLQKWVESILKLQNQQQQTVY